MSSLPRCAGCGGWGVGVVNDRTGQCAHCERLAPAPAAAGGKKRPRPVDSADDDNEVPARRRDDALPDDIARLLAEADASDVPALDTHGVKRMLLKLEKAISKNALLRAKHSDAPGKFLESEVELDRELQALRSLAAAPDQYRVLAGSESLKSLLALFAHDNSDIAQGVVAVLAELTGEDAVGPDAPLVNVPGAGGDADGDGDGGGGGADSVDPNEEGRGLVDAFLAAGAPELLLAHLERVDKEAGEDAAGSVFATLVLVGQLVELRGSAAADALVRVPATSAAAGPTASRPASSSASSRLLAFLLRKLRAVKEYDDVKGAAAELLSIVLAADPAATSGVRAMGEGRYPLTSPRDGTHLIDGVEYLLEILNAYRKRQPTTKEEEECVENLFDALATCLLVPANRARFRAAEGFELMLRVVGEAGFARYGALRTISHAVANSAENCTALVAAGGLKAVFPAFMGKGAAHTRKCHGADAARSEVESALGVLSACLQLLPAAAPGATPAPGKGLERMRVLSKFKEASAAGSGVGVGAGAGAASSSASILDKVARAVELRVVYGAKVARLGPDGRRSGPRGEDDDEEDESEDEEDDEEEDDDDEMRAERVYMRRLRRGLYPLQRVDTVLAHLLTSGDADLAFAVRAKLYEQGESVVRVLDVLDELAAHLGGDGGGEGAGAAAAEKESVVRLLEQLAENSGLGGGGDGDGGG
jgi:beta-catenin-like protein 1